MATDSKIQWTNHTVNFWTGCEKVAAGCKYCYMYRDKSRYKPKPEKYALLNDEQKAYFDPKNVVRTSDSTVRGSLKNAKPGDLVFTCSWSDFFIEEADEWRTWAWNIIRSRPDLKWQILTKRWDRILANLPEDWGNGWDNVWIGVTVENQETAEVRIPALLQIPAAVRFVSFEPLLTEVNIDHLLWRYSQTTNLRMPVIGWDQYDKRGNAGIDWAILGGESGNDVGKYLYRVAEEGWFTTLIPQLQEASAAVFVKQTGTGLSKKLGLRDRHGGDMAEWPKHLQIRQLPISH